MKLDKACVIKSDDLLDGRIITKSENDSLYLDSNSLDILAKKF